MQCTSPFHVRDFDIDVPCGHCLACRIAKSREWTVRLLSEYGYWQQSCFLTLTYDELNVPLTLRKREMQLFWKRIRKAIAPRKLKYFCCGEYGEKYGRPHYHAICFGIDWSDEDIINRCWNKGFIKIGNVTTKSIGYVTSYVLKKWSNKEEKENYEKIGMEPPFQLVSQGLGLQFALDNREQLQDNLGLTLNGKSVGLPKYFVRKLEIDTDIMAEYSKKSNVDKIANICRKLGIKQSKFPQYALEIAMWYNYDGTPLAKDKLSCYLRAEMQQRDVHLKSMDRFQKGEF